MCIYTYIHIPTLYFEQLNWAPELQPKMCKPCWHALALFPMHCPSGCLLVGFLGLGFTLGTTTFQPLCRFCWHQRPQCLSSAKELASFLQAFENINCIGRSPSDLRGRIWSQRLAGWHSSKSQGTCLESSLNRNSNPDFASSLVFYFHGVWS